MIALLDVFPMGTPLSYLQAAMTGMGAKCFDVENNILACRYTEATLSMVKKVWSIAFHLDSEQRLVSVKLSRGLVGP